jgi:hypothetical protein
VKLNPMEALDVQVGEVVAGTLVHMGTLRARKRRPTAKSDKRMREAMLALFALKKASLEAEKAVREAIRP